MHTPEKVLIVDSDPRACGEIENAMRGDNYSILTANNYDEAMNLIASEKVSRIILGTNSTGSGSDQFIQQVSEHTSGKNTMVCHLKDTDSECSNFPSSASPLTQFAISRTSDISHLREKFQSVDLDTHNHQDSKVENLLDEVFGTLKEYTEEMTSSIRYASTIQKALLPGENSLGRVIESFVFNSPKNIVSGDFFWFTIRYGRVILASVDCTGHGVPAALLSIIGHDMLNSIVNEKNITEPAQILKQMNQRVQRIFENSENGCSVIKDGMDIAIISIDPNTRSIDFAGARRPLCGFINGEFVKIKGDLYSIGIHSPISAEFKQHRITFGLHDMFYLGSDGFTDQFGGPDHKKIGTRKFEQFLGALRRFDVKEQKLRAETFFRDWKKHYEQTDDVLLLGIKPGSLLC